MNLKMRSRWRLLGAILLAQQLAGLLAPLQHRSSIIAQVHCTSSYIEDFFLPGAKLALNKIQQSFQAPTTADDENDRANFQLQDSPTASKSTNESESPAPSRDQTALLNPKSYDATTTTTATATTTTTTTTEKQSETEPPNRLNVNLNSEQISTSEPQTSTSTIKPPTEVVEESNLKTEAVIPSGTAAPPEDKANELATVAPSGGSDTETTSRRPADSSTESAAAASSSTAAPPVSVQVAREQELDAIAAVDATIGFGSNDLFASSAADLCYDEYGNAQYCEPEFENVALEKQVEVSSECGKTPTRFCTLLHVEQTTAASGSGGGGSGGTQRAATSEQVRNCHICDAQHPKRRHPATYLTDLNNPAAPTCWVSAPIGLGGERAAPGNKLAEVAAAPRHDNVSLRVNLDKKYEITYVSVQFCSLRADSLALYKSADFGQSWQPYQFYSSHCNQMYPQQSADAQAQCVGWPSGAPTNRISFSTAEAAKRRHTDETSGEQQQQQQRADWTSATNIKLVLDRHQASWIQSSLAYSSASQHHRSNSTEPSGAVELLEPSDTYNYAIQDLTIGGRCKCNGHASRCVHSKEGRLQCDCRHNTAGRDCERCAPFHFDRPWQRATHSDASPCQPCNCNGHSRKCRFDAELYRLSGNRSGGVCINCRDNTAGRHCHYCKENYTRDHTKPISHKEACKPCDCHPVGSLGRVCNQTSGQCPCKEGVTGLECNRCAPGYQQSNSPSEPCIKLPENDINYEPTIEQQSNGNDPEPSISFVSTPAPAAADSLDNQPAHVAPSGGLDPDELVVNHVDSNRIDSSGIGSYAVDDFEQPQWHQSSKSRQPTRQRNWQQQQQQHSHRHLGKPMRPRPSQLDADETGGEPSDAADDQLAPDEQLATGGAARGHQSNWRRVPAAQRSKGGGEMRVVASNAMANLDPAAGDEDSLLSAAEQNQPPMSFVPQPNFNQRRIHQRPNSYAHAHTQVTSKQRKQQQQQQHLHNHHQQSASSPAYSSRRRLPQLGADELTIGANEIGAIQQQELSCAECQSGTRRLSFRQFCQLEFAIRATVLHKFMSNDWTRFDVEIHDIFKSSWRPAAGSSGARLAGASLDSFFQSDEPTGVNKTGSGGSSEQQQQQQQQEDSMEQPRPLRVGSIQSIWVPTEDVNCKCPRLKAHSSYLLMGLLDGRDSSPAAVQLDRHGVALEWRSSLQERLVKYQRRQARGRCQSTGRSQLD